MPPYRFLVLGGYGVFGSRIARRLALTKGCHVTIGGRDLKSAETFCAAVNSEVATADKSSAHRVPASAVRVDAGDHDALQETLRSNSIDCVIHTAGPFQSHADYSAARSIITAGVNYIDIADARRYICDFPRELNELAVKHNVVAVTGASSVPGISTSILDHLIAKAGNPKGGAELAPGAAEPAAQQQQYRHPYAMPAGVKLRSIDIGINPGNQTPRGIATVKSILSYCGHPITIMENGQWKSRIGWAPSDMVCRQYPLRYSPRRHLVSCDVADLELLPSYYDCPTVHFRAGLELAFLTISTSLMSLLVHPLGLVKDLSVFGTPLAKLSLLVRRWGSTAGAMHVEIVYSRRREGEDVERLFRRTYFLCADCGTNNPELLNTPGHTSGPEIPCTPAVIIAQRLAAAAAVSAGGGEGERSATPPAVSKPNSTPGSAAPSAYSPGAYPCLSLFSVDCALASLKDTCGDKIWTVEEDEVEVTDMDSAPRHKPWWKL